MAQNKATIKYKRDGSDFRYVELANDLRKQLKEGKFNSGDRFYSVRWLMSKTQRSLPTVRSAISMLVEEGFLEPKHGSGYYVTKKIERHKGEGALKILVVLPSFATPSEPWFTGKILSGMIHTAELNKGIISFLQRSDPPYENFAVDIELEKILATEPDAIAWLHASPNDRPLLEKLKETGLPLLTTMREFKDLDIPFIGEDDLLYASMVLSPLRALGHRQLGIITGNPADGYYSSKIAALKDIGQALDVEVSESDLFYFRAKGKKEYDFHSSRIREFISERKTLTAILVLKSDGINPLINLMKTSFQTTLSKVSLIFNVLDGVSVPELPMGRQIATISPPLIQLGEYIFTMLKNKSYERPYPAVPRLIPVFRPGSSLKKPSFR